MSSKREKYVYFKDAEGGPVLPERMTGLLTEIRQFSRPNETVEYELRLDSGVVIYLPPVSAADRQYLAGDAFLIEPLTHKFKSTEEVVAGVKHIVVTRGEERVGGFSIPKDWIRLD